MKLIRNVLSEISRLKVFRQSFGWVLNDSLITVYGFKIVSGCLLAVSECFFWFLDNALNDFWIKHYDQT
ncbi:uncharacterized protein OCT59_001012 [Rhizophagus irregularis]|uniref:uncharacterized protein n=1 Tax=Rhizophagus irregularis TaxID=588596 RepID=UPI00332E2100|nr:hypothetical protein OCT59_001012 [Rhizophagus irregularis]